MKTTARILAAALLLVGYGCAGPDDGGADDGLHAVSPDKADDYYSNVAAEFEVTVTLPVALTEDEAADPELRADRARRRATAFGLYLTAYVTAKFEGIDRNGDGVISDDERFFFNMGYGDFNAMVRSGTVDDIEVVEDGDGGWVTTFTIDMAGPPNLPSLIPAAPDAPESVSELVFDVQMPAGATIDPSNVPRRDFRRFDPRTYEGELETVRCSMVRHPDVSNAYPRFDAFVEDGLFDITLFFGHDYNDSRSDLREAREAFTTLRQLGFTTPAQSFDELAADSGPFTRRGTANGREVFFEVRVYHSDMFTTARRAQHDLALSEIVTRDVFFYNGHAGPYYGFYLDANDEAAVGYHEFAAAPFQAGRQQLVVAQGCQTYSNYSDMLYANRAKSETNLDVITTVNYSYGRGTMGVLRSLLRFDSEGNHQPTDYYRIIADLNSEWLNSYRDVFYGITGISENPQIHPYAALESIGRSCARAVDCGDPAGNVCIPFEQGEEPTCGAVTLSPDACPEGTLHRALASGSRITGGACFAAPAPPPPAGDQVFESTPALAIPDNDPAGASDTITVPSTLRIGGLRVEVDITHSWRGDLVVDLVRNGQTATLVSREGGSADDIVRSFTVEGFTGAEAGGEWTLLVSDRARLDVGTLNAWRLVVTPL